MAKGRLTPANIMHLGMGFWGSKTLLSAIELGLFTELANGPLDASALTKRLQLHPRSARDFFDALVALGMLKRTGQRYANTAETALFLNRAQPSYVGGILEMSNARLYRFWGSLTEGLRTGKPQNEVKTGEDFFGTLYADPQRLEGFLKAMTGLSIGSAKIIAKKFPWKKYRTFADVGCAQGGVAVEIALAHKHLMGRRDGSSSGAADIRGLCEGARHRATATLSPRGFLQRPAAEVRCDCHGAYPPRLGPGRKDDASSQGL